MGSQLPGGQQQQARPRFPPLRRPTLFFIGLDIGLVPLCMMVIYIGMGAGANFLGNILGYVFLAVIVACIVCLVVRSVRFIGYGILMMLLITPCVYNIACQAAARAGILCFYRCIAP